MANILANQPIIFNESIDSCSTDTTYYTQIVDNTDTTQFQLGLTVCNGQSNLFPEATFTDPANYIFGTDWSITNGLICKTTGQPSGFLSTVILPINKYYKIEIIVDSCSAGASFDIYLDNNVVGTFTTAGTYTIYGFVLTAAYSLGILSTVASGTCCIRSITGYEILTNFGIAIYNDSDVYQDTIWYSTDPTYFTFAEDTVTVSIDWAALSIQDGCYYLCLLDTCLNTGGQNYPPAITNGTFTGSSTGWALGSSWVYSANAMNATFSATVANNWMEQANVFTNLTSTYSVTVILTAHTGNVSIYFGTQYVGNCTGIGTFVLTGIPVGSLTLKAYITSGTATVTSILATAIPTSSYVCDYQSNTVKIGDYSCACPETLLINACNDENGLGFVFNGSGFTPRLRLQGKLKKSTYKAERTIEEDSNGTKRVIYYNRRKSKNLVADLLPEYIHDFLSTLSGYDRFYINGTAYVVDDDEYNVTYDDSQDNVGGVSLLVSEQTQLIRNTNCSADEGSCALPQLDCDTGLFVGNYILQEDDINNTQFITLENGEELELE